MEGPRWHVHKFGGTSLADAGRVRAVADIVGGRIERGERTCTVVSAMASVTDELHALVELARLRDTQWEKRFDHLVGRHTKAADALLAEGSLDEETSRELGQKLEHEANDLRALFRATGLMRSASERAVEFVAGHGELWSARLMAATIRGRSQCPVEMVDAREVLVLEDDPSASLDGDTTHPHPKVAWEETRAKVAARQDEPEEAAPHWVVTGYVAADRTGTPTTLKRNGSDLSAALFGNLLRAASITIWTDVDGVLTADPRKVPDARVQPDLSYAEAAELAYFGAKVLHPHTMAPAVEQEIPIFIKNSFAPERRGSRIGRQEGERSKERSVVAGLATIDDVALVNVEGSGMMGVPGVAERLFRALRDRHINVNMISQASSEHSICVAVPAGDGAEAEEAIARVFQAELEDKQIDRVSLVGPCSILAAVGDRMAEVPGVAGRMMNALGKAGVNVRAVAQGTNERNISVALDQDEVVRGLRAVHASFTLSDQTLSIGLIGPGGIGATLLEQLERQAAELEERFHIDLRVRALANSKRMVLAPEAIRLSSWREELDRGEPVDLERLADHVGASHLPHAAILDCTASSTVADHTQQWLERGLHVVTPNKKACAGDLQTYQALQRLREKDRVHFFYEATVGAGLPILSTLRDLVKTGDRVLRIEGVLSGTLSYLFNNYRGDPPFSKLVQEARDLGYTEPDPRDDLSGTDVARKVVILAREMGLDAQLESVEVESLIPAGLEDAPSAEAFLQALTDHDGAMKARLDGAEAEGAVLRVVGEVDPEGGLSVRLKNVPRDHAFAGLTGSDNILAFTTERYRDQPLIVRGPGAGPEVTAAGVFSDLLRLCGHLGARS